MTRLLHIDASARGQRSLSRALSSDFISQWRKLRPEDCVIRRDVAAQPPPHVTEQWIASAFTAPDQRSPAQMEALAVSESLVDELLDADVLVIGSPMYNYGMPSTLKAWLDQVIRVGRTFSFDLSRGEQPIEPIQTGKTLVMLTSAGEGGFDRGDANLNHLDPHLVAASRLLGVSACHAVRIEYQEFGDERHSASIAAAHAAIPGLIDKILIERQL